MSAPSGHQRKTHWLLRTAAVLMGFFLLLLGGVFVIACLATMAQGANNPAAAKVGMGVQIAATVIFALVALSGAFLMWLGLKRSKQSVELARYTAEHPIAEVHLESSAAAMAIPEAPPIYQEASVPCPTAVYREVDAAQVAVAASGRPRQSRPADPELGEFVASCGPERSGQLHYYVWAGALLVFAVFCAAAPGNLIEIQPGHEKVATLLSLGTAGLSLLFALGMVWRPLLGSPQIIELYERGLVERLGEQARRIELAAIQHLQVREWYEHRFAQRTFNVEARVQGQKQLKFSSELRGEAERIIECLASCIPQTEFIEFDATL